MATLLIDRLHIDARFNSCHQSQPLLELRLERTPIAAPLPRLPTTEPDNTSATHTQQPVDSWAGTIQGLASMTLSLIALLVSLLSLGYSIYVDRKLND